MAAFRADPEAAILIGVLGVAGRTFHRVGHYSPRRPSRARRTLSAGKRWIGSESFTMASSPGRTQENLGVREKFCGIEVRNLRLRPFDVAAGGGS
jgi:hypothetical protein